MYKLTVAIVFALIALPVLADNNDTEAQVSESEAKPAESPVSLVRMSLIDVCETSSTRCLRVEWQGSVDDGKCPRGLVTTISQSEGSDQHFKKCEVESPLAYGRFRPLDLEDATPGLMRLARAGNGDAINDRVASILHPNQ